MEKIFWVKAVLLFIALSSFSMGLHSSQKKEMEQPAKQEWDTSNEVHRHQIYVQDTIPMPPDTLPVPEPPPIPLPVPPDTVPVVK